MLSIAKNYHREQARWAMPRHLQGSELREFLESYFTFLSQQSTTKLRDILSERDLTTLENTFIDALAKEFSSVTNSNVNTKFLISKLVYLWKSKGSDDSVSAFFRIFFKDEVSIYTPSKDIFELSSAVWSTDNTEDRAESGEAFSDEGSFLSSRKKLFDGRYWQRFSYEITSKLQIVEWKEVFMKMLHPASLALFARYIIFLDGSSINFIKLANQPGWINWRSRKFAFFFFTNLEITANSEINSITEITE